MEQLKGVCVCGGGHERNKSQSFECKQLYIFQVSEEFLETQPQNRTSIINGKSTQIEWETCLYCNERQQRHALHCVTNRQDGWFIS